MDTKTPKPKQHLRRLRRGVTLRFNGYDLEGVPHWLLYDAGRNNFFAIGWPEYEMLSRWSLGDGQAIVDAVNRETTLIIEIQDFENLKKFLYENYLVEHRWRNVYLKAKEHRLIKGENVFYWFLRYYLFFRVPLFKPDKFLDKTKAFGDFLFSQYTLYLMTFLGVIAIYQIGIRWEEFIHTFASIFSWQGLFFYLIAFTIAKLFHELGHAYMCKHYGVSVPTIGVAFLVFWPVLYTDTTLSWSLPSQQRLRITMAGMWVETYLTIIAALIWSNVHNVTIQMICYVTVAVNWVGTLLINVSPFMRFDGYYALSDILKMPNLQNRSFDLARWQLRQWLFDLREPPPEQFSKRMQRFLISYAYITWLYRLIIYFGIAVLVYHYFFKVAGIILFVIEIYAFILRPIIFELKRLYEMRERFKLNTRTIITLAALGILIFLLFAPLDKNITLNATLGYNHELFFAPQEGILQSSLPKPGTKVAANETIAVINSMDVDYNLKRAELEYEKISIKIRRSSLDPDFSKQKNNLIAEQREKKADYDKWLGIKEKLTLKASFNGIIAEVAHGLYPGIILRRNEYILDIIDPQKIMVEAFVEEEDVNLLQIGTQGFFYSNNLDVPIFPVKVLAIEHVNTKFLATQYSRELKQTENKEVIIDTPSYHASVLGGKIPTEITEEGKYVPVKSIYRVILLPEEKLVIKNIQTGSVTLKVKSRAFISNPSKKIKNIFIKESGF